jgi:pyruvate kinase
VFSLNHDVDWVSISFVRSAKDIEKVREVIEDYSSNIRLIAKIEKHEAIKNIDSIIGISHGVMVARGDLGAEIPIEDVPKYQKMIINHCNQQGKPVIIATQMLESMVKNPRPTRAEANDVANAVYDGASAVMLSAETAIGKYPVESVRIMSRIINSTESIINYGVKMMEKLKTGYKSVTDSIALASCEIAKNLDAVAIITSTQSGHTAREISKNHPSTPIVAVSPIQRVVNQLKLSWGVYPILSKRSKSIDEMIDNAVKLALENKFIRKGDIVVITAGVLVDRPGTTNMLKVHIV